MKRNFKRTHYHIPAPRARLYKYKMGIKLHGELERHFETYSVYA